MFTFFQGGQDVDIILNYEKKRSVMRINTHSLTVKNIRQKVAKKLGMHPLVLKLSIFDDCKNKFISLMRDNQMQGAACLEINVLKAPTAHIEEMIAMEDDDYLEDDFFEGDDDVEDSENYNNRKRTGLPEPYVIPLQTIPMYVRKAVKSGEALSKSHISAITTALYEDITSYIFYPSPVQYDLITSALINALPG